MKQAFTFLIFALLVSPVISQVYIDEFDDGVESNISLGTGYTSIEENGEWSITGDGSGGAFEVFSLTPNNEDGTPLIIDISENNKIYVRVKASNLGTQLRMDVRDAEGFASTLGSVTKSLVSDYTVFEYDFTGALNDGGFGGTACESADAPCPVDPTQIAGFDFYVNPGQGAFGGAIVFDFVSVGSAPNVGPISEVWQDNFDDETVLGFLSSSTPGLTNTISNSSWNIVGDGTGGMWEPVNMLFFNPTTLDTIDVPVSEGNDKVFIRMRSAVPGTTIRVDLQDINDMATTGGSITKAISDEWVTYEYNYAGAYSDLGFGGTGCSSDQAPCPVDSDRIANLILFINPGVGAFAGQVEIEYISIGTALEADGGDEGQLVYGDHFSGGDNYVNTAGSFELSVDNSTLKINGTGVDAPFAAVAYSIHDMDTGAGSFVDATGNNKLYIKARSNTPNTLLRIDLVDTAGFVTTLPSFTRLLEEDYGVIELDFSGQYTDGGYGGTPCDASVAPCNVEGTAIGTVLLYPNPADGGFAGCLEVDYISFGKPMGEDVKAYIDNFDNENRDQWSDADGFTVEETGSELTISGDGSAGPFAAFNYTLHDTETFAPLVVDVTSNNKLYIKAKSTIDGTPLRVDLMDEGGFATTEPATIVTVGEEYEVLEFDFTGTYMDGGYGGTSCMTGPCPVDGSALTTLLVYIDPNNGGFDGTLTIDWISTIEPLENLDEPEIPVGIDDYTDVMEDNSLDFISNADGIATVAEDGLLKLIGDGTSGEFAAVFYKLHDGLDSVIVNALNNDSKLYIRATSTVDLVPLRIDLIDYEGFNTTLAGITNPVASTFETLEYDFTNNYLDGGYGGTACATGPCPVDGERIEQLSFYVDPGIGSFEGEVHIDWIAFGEPITVSVLDQNILSSARIFPNPSSGQVHVEMNTLKSGSITSTVLDLNGKVVQSNNHGFQYSGNSSNSLDLSMMNSGMYIINVALDGVPVFYQKILID